MDAIFAKALEFLSSVEGASATVAIVLEFVFRLFPSEKPLSVLYIVALVLRKSGEIFIKGGELLDKILPQKLK